MIAPRANGHFVGHGGAVAALVGAAGGGRLHHAWLLGGMAGVGKATLAYRFARWLLAGGTTADLSVPEGHPVFRRVAAGTHADLLVIERRFDEKRKKMQGEIVIETVLEVGTFLRLTAGEGGWRVVVVDGAEDMNRNAANALLKLLEEPPRRALIILVSHAPGRLLPTIRSRCRTLNLGSLADGEVQGLLGIYAPGVSVADGGRLARLAEGSVGRALMLADDGGVALSGLADEVLAGPVGAGRAMTVVDAVVRVDDGFEIFMALLRAGLAAETRRLARAGGRRLAGRVGVWQEFGRLEREVESLNLDKRAAMIVALNQLHG